MPEQRTARFGLRLVLYVGRNKLRAVTAPSWHLARVRLRSGMLRWEATLRVKS